MKSAKAKVDYPMVLPEKEVAAKAQPVEPELPALQTETSVPVALPANIEKQPISAPLTGISLVLLLLIYAVRRIFGSKVQPEKKSV